MLKQTWKSNCKQKTKFTEHDRWMNMRYLVIKSALENLLTMKSLGWEIGGCLLWEESG